MGVWVRVVDPDGVSWTVRRRWFPWRRVLGLREVWYSSTTSGEDDVAAAQDAETTRPGAVLAAVGIVLWLIIGLGKAILIAVAVVLVVAASTIDLVLQLAVAPVVLLARAVGLTRWPVQVDRRNLYVRTESADGFAAAAALRDRVAAQIAGGSGAD